MHNLYKLETQNDTKNAVSAFAINNSK